MTTKILFESDYFEPDYFEQWVAACEAHGVEYKIASRDDWMENFNLRSCFTGPVYVFGSIQFFQHLQKMNMDWRIANNVTWERYECTSYYPYLSQYLLNDDYTMLPFDEVDKKKGKLFERFGNNDCIFIRPNEGTKPFTGTVFAKSVLQWDRSMRLLGFYDEAVKPSTLCVVSEPRNIVTEWRFVVVDQKVISGSQYKVRRLSQFEVEHVNIDRFRSTNAFSLAQTVADKYQPDDMFTVDICQTKDSEIHLLEINGFGCAGMYACDRDKIVETLVKRDKK